MKTRIISIAVILALVAGIGLLLKRSHDKVNEGKINLLSSNIYVSTAAVNETSTATSITLTGTLTANTEIVVAAQTAGQLTSLNAELGQVKAKGAVLGTVDNRLKVLALQTAQINLDKQKRDLKRYESLIQGGTITQQQMDDAKMAYDNAVIQFEQAKKQLTDATIKAPISGVITEKLAEAGSYTNIGTGIVRMVDISKLKIRMNVSETNVYKLKVGDQAEIQCEVIPGKTFSGKISYIASKGDESHNYPVEVIIPNNGKLRAGTFASVKIDLPGSGSSLCIPRQSLLGSSRDAKVYVIKNDVAEIRNITVTGSNDKVLFVSAGLSKGEQVVTAGQINLTNGMKVSISKK